MSKKNDCDEYNVIYIPLGMALGSGLGVVFNNVGIGISLGVLSGAIIDIVVYFHKKKK